MTNNQVFAVFIIFMVLVYTVVVLAGWRESLRGKEKKIKIKSFDYNDICKSLGVIRDVNAKEYMPYFEEKYYTGYNFNIDSSEKLVDYKENENTLYLNKNISKYDKELIDYSIHKSIGEMLSFRVDPEIKYTDAYRIITLLARFKKPNENPQRKNVVGKSIYTAIAIAKNISSFAKEAQPDGIYTKRAARQIIAHSYALLTYKKRGAYIPNTAPANYMITFAQSLIKKNKALTDKFLDK